ncbi:MAG: N-6 DNA methylase [Candidatus Gracilibacteria bacterium]|nr:N-6 DNA methylase [Candidatus Gracilibacteria bacterium]
MSELQIKDNKIFCLLKNEWHILTPEEEVRQKYIQVLINDYGYNPNQMEQELKVNNSDRGNGRASADIVIWKTEEERKARKKPLIVVECKSDNVVIRTKDYYQGLNYASWAGAKFFVTHNSKETKFFQVIDDIMPNLPDEILNIPTSTATEKEIKQLLEETKAFSREEFTNLLKNCHNSIRNRDALDPASAFDEISKLLFIKINFERQDKYGKIFTKKYIEEQEENFDKIIKPSLSISDPVKFGSMSYIQFLFENTKQNFREDKLFEDNERIKLKDSTFKDIVSKLEKYNLSKTGDDIKGIAFEKFLGQTFRGEIGQFFTPRSVVEFIVDFLDVKEGQKVIDPASGSGGFLIRFFQEVLGQIEDDIQTKKDKIKEEIDKMNLSEEENAKKLNEEFVKLNQELEKREWHLATKCVYGTDKNSRMARTSKMNMIMHGDGHGGVHHHDGLINVGEIEDEMFDLVITNPPFGASVFDEIGEVPVLPKYKLSSGKSSQKTEILFIERCLNLLKPAGKMGVVLPEGILNNPSLQYVREFAEGKAKILAVVSLPVDTFISSKASVKSSIIFLQKFSEEEKLNYENTSKQIEEKYNKEIQKIEKEYNEKIKIADKEDKKIIKSELKKLIDDLINQSKKEQKKSLNYPIFMAEVTNSGITSTGATDSEGNELPLVTQEYRKFQKELFNYQGK